MKFITVMHQVLQESESSLWLYMNCYIYGTDDQTSSQNIYNILYLLFIHSEFKENE